VDVALAAGDVEAARRLLPSLVGRSTDGLDEKEIARAVIESVAENLSDAVVASALWGLVGGAPGVLAHRAANTLDAMVGHRSRRYLRFGWAAARADDALGWPAARCTAAFVALARPSRAGEVWRAVRRDAPGHPSPNAGVAEAAFAAALGLTLGGENRYGDRVEVRSALGVGRPPGPDDIAGAVALANRVRWLLLAATVALAVAAGRQRAPGEPGGPGGSLWRSTGSAS
jgi:adenosylcobinamide-phosphate synthase